jgi:putative DNA primase/helicase
MRLAVTEDTQNSKEPIALGSPIRKADEDKLAMVFAQTYTDVFLFSAQHGKWFFWNGQFWVKDETFVVREHIRRLARAHNVNETVSMSRASFVSGIEKHAKGDVNFSIHGSELDRDHQLLNTPDGTYNLVTGLRQQHNPNDRITKIAAVSPSPVGGTVFTKFLDEITQGDLDLQLFLQRLLGSILSGAREEHWIAFWIGDGRNGKSTLAEAIEFVLGNYAKKISASVLLSQKYDAHPTEIANLQGIRMALSSEIQEGSFINEAKIKELTGDEVISARYMRQDFFEFQRTHKHIVLGNSRPQLRTIDPAMRSRLKLVPFKACFVEKEDHSLADKLRNDAGYILHWLMEGHRMWLESERHIGSCAAVEAELDEYFSSQSTPDMWIRECCTAVSDEGQPKSFWNTSTQLYESYQSWKKARSETPLSLTRWAEFMKRHFVAGRSDGIRYAGVKLTPKK